MYSHFPFHQIGFRCNPFRVLTDEEWVAVTVIPPALENIINTPNHLQLLGEMGHGKSTTLLALQARLVTIEQPVVLEYLPRGQHHLKTSFRDLTIFIVDEAQRLWPWEWMRLLVWVQKGGHRLVIGSHADMQWLFQLAGMPLETCSLDYSAYLPEILERRLSFFALEDPCPTYFTPDAIEFLQGRFGANLRAIQYFLYEVFQRLPSRGGLTGDTLQQAAIDLGAIK